MSERIRPRAPQAQALPSAPAETPLAQRLVGVSHGIYSERLPVAGLSVAQVRARFGDRLGIAPDALAWVNGQPADDQAVLASDQMLVFGRLAGEKGVAA